MRKVIPDLKVVNIHQISMSILSKSTNPRQTKYITQTSTLIFETEFSSFLFAKTLPRKQKRKRTGERKCKFESCPYKPKRASEEERERGLIDLYPARGWEKGKNWKRAFLHVESESGRNTHRQNRKMPIAAERNSKTRRQRNFDSHNSHNRRPKPAAWCNHGFCRLYSILITRLQYKNFSCFLQFWFILWFDR